MSSKHDIHLERIVKIEHKRDFEEKCYRGLAYYGEHDKPVEHLVLTAQTGDTVDLLKNFNIFQRKILRNVKWGWKRSIQFIGVVMVEPHYHIHMLIRKPYMDIYKLRRLWQESYKEGSHIEIKFVYKDKELRSQMSRLVTYIMNNPEEHQSEDYYYFASLRWGLK